MLLRPEPHRFLPADPAVRALASSLYADVRDAAIISPHGHVDAAMIADDTPFPDPAALLITPDHYVLRLLHAHGVGLDRLGRGGDAEPREIWRLFAEHWPRFAGTPVRAWFEDTLSSLFSLSEHPSSENADAQYDTIAAWIADPDSRPRALFERFSIDVLATTDDPVDTLDAHRRLRDDASFRSRVLPTFRADRFLDPSSAGWRGALRELASVTGLDTETAGGMIRALESRREHFRSLGATATDTGVVDPWATRLTEEALERLHREGLAGTVTQEGAAAYRRHMLWELARMSSEDGLVMQLHPGVLRNHHTPTLARFGPDTGHDLPLFTEYARPLRELLNDFGTHPTFRIVLFTVDETSFARDLGPLAGFYPSVFVGAPWWFLDTPQAMRRFRDAVTDSAGFYKTSGFIDDTRAFLSIPTRHDVSRRVDAGMLAHMVVSGELGEEEARRINRDLVDTIPREVFRLGGGG